jgi:carbamoyl-phosphate synthase large subunit
MEHIEEAGVHSGDSACSLPPYSLDETVVEEIRRQMTALALELGVVGLMNAQFAVKDKTVYVLEVNPRGSRTVPFVSKAIGVPLAKLAMKTMIGRSLDDLGFVTAPKPVHLSVKEAVFPFNKFPGVDVLLGPEMKSTGEVMGIDADFGWAFAKSQAGAGAMLPMSGMAFISVKETDRPAALQVSKQLHRLGFGIQATSGTAGYLRDHGLEVKTVLKVTEGRPHIVDLIKNGEVDPAGSVEQGIGVLHDDARRAGRCDGHRSHFEKGIDDSLTPRVPLQALEEPKELCQHRSRRKATMRSKPSWIVCARSSGRR